MKRMYTVPSNFTLQAPSSGNIVINGTFAYKTADGSFEYDNINGASPLYDMDYKKSNVGQGIHYKNSLLSYPSGTKKNISFPTKLTSKPTDFYIDLNYTKYSGDNKPHLTIQNFININKDSDAPMILISMNDGILELSNRDPNNDGNRKDSQFIYANNWDLTSNKEPDGLLAKLAEMGIVLDEAAQGEEGEYLCKIPPELYGFNAEKGTVTIDANTLPKDFFDHVAFKLYACPLERIIY